MRLTKYQKARLLEHEWDIIETEVDGQKQNCRWVSIFSDDGGLFGEIIEDFGLTGDSDCVKLLVIATSEQD